jgi:transcriptional regulator with XRE-family HTH domain
MKERGWTISELARHSGVHQSQLSRILSGDFKIFSSNVMQICKTIGLETDRSRTRSRSEQDREAIADSALGIWDGSAKDREVVVSLLNQIARMRKPSRASPGD